MRLEADSSLKAEPGKIETRIRGDVLSLPLEIALAADVMNLNSEASLLSSLQSFPTAWKETLDWSYEEIQLACRNLCDQLRGHTHDALLDAIDNSQPIQRTYGALPPPDAHYQKGTTANSEIVAGDSKEYDQRDEISTADNGPRPERPLP